MEALLGKGVRTRRGLCSGLVHLVRQMALLGIGLSAGQGLPKISVSMSSCVAVIICKDHGALRPSA